MPIVVLVELAPLESLKPHEEASASKARKIARSILREKALYKPLIVEEKTRTIMDGHHRYYALRLLGAKYAPIVLASYSRDVERVDSLPIKLLLDSSLEPERVLDLLEKTITSITKKGHKELLVEYGGLRAVLRVDPLDFYSFTAKRLAEQYSGVFRAVSRRPARAYIYPPPLSGWEITRAATRGLILAPKSSIHRTALKSLMAPFSLESFF